MGARTRNSTPKRPSRKTKKATNATPEAAAAIADRLAERWPGVVVELDHQNAYQLLVATILAAQSTDKLINTITPAVFAKYPDATALSQAIPADLEQLVFKSGFYRQKSGSLIKAATAIVERHAGEVPSTIEELCELPGVARKTANVVLGNALGKNEGIVVDTHVMRVAGRLGLTREADPTKIENDLMALIPRERWTDFGNQMIHHGRYLCRAKDPQCDACPLAPLCPSAGLGIMLAKKPKAKAAAKPKARKPKPKPKAKKSKPRARA